MSRRTPVLETRNRRGNATLRAEGPLAIYAAVVLRLIWWVGIVILAILGGPLARHAAEPLDALVELVLGLVASW